MTNDYDPIKRTGLRYRGEPVDEMSREQLLNIIYDMAARAGVPARLFGFPVRFSDDMPEVTIRFGPPLI